MRKALVNEATGAVENIVVLPAEPEDPPYAPPEGRVLIDDDGTAQIGGTWDGARFVAKPPPDPAAVDAIKALEAGRLLDRAADATFLDGHWITLTALAGAGTVTGVAAIDDAVAAGDKAAFARFFKDQVKARL